jgi:hypothetical protein
VREENNDSTAPVNYVGPNPPQQPQHVNGTYIWGNRANLTGGTIGTDLGYNCGVLGCYTGDIPKAGRDYYTGSTTPGITCGTLANRPSTCTANQGYWATNQSCTDLTGMVGANPATPISGTLYRCTASNTWDSGASSLPYPHPLIAESNGTSSGSLSPPSRLRLIP